MIEPTSPRPDAATALFNLPDPRVTDTEVLAFGQRRVRVEATAEARPVEVVWTKRRLFCDKHLCPRRTSAGETSQVPRRGRSTRRPRGGRPLVRGLVAARAAGPGFRGGDAARFRHPGTADARRR